MVTVASSTVILWSMVYVQYTCGDITSSWPNRDALGQPAANQVVPLGGDITSSWPNRDSLGQPATSQLVTRDNLNHDQSNQQDDSRVRLLMECHETVGSLRRDMEILQQSKDPEGSESNEGRGMRQVLQEVQGAVEELRIKDVEINQTLALFEEQMEMLIRKHEGTDPEGSESNEEQMEMLIRKHDGAGCESGGVLYHNGDIIQDQCYPTKCNNGAMAVYLNHTTGNPCAPPFEPMTTGCYYYNSTSVTWCVARKHCWQMGGDLAMGPDFNTLEAYVTFKAGIGNLVWVGVRDDVWLTGQPPNSQEWSSGNPNTNQYKCGRINNKKLADTPCVQAKHFVCQLF